MWPLVTTVILLISLAGYIFLFLKLRQMVADLATTRATSEQLAAGMNDLTGRLPRSPSQDGGQAASRKSEAALAALADDVATLRREAAATASAVEAIATRFAATGQAISDLNALLRAGGTAGSPESRTDALVRRHLANMGINTVAVDAHVQREDGSEALRVRGLRGEELWNGRVVVRDGSVESAAAVGYRMFP